MELKIEHKYILELLDYESKSLVGKACKRFEIINTVVKNKEGQILENESESRKEILKSEVKELIYEEFRRLRDLLVAGGRGLEQKIWKFNK